MMCQPCAVMMCQPRAVMMCQARAVMLLLLMMLQPLCCDIDVFDVVSALCYY
jgi:hypothetical protein